MGRLGFRRVDNNTFKALMASNLSKGGIYSVLAIIHETIGFQREKAKIPMSKFLWHTELPKSAIRRGLKEAEARTIIIKERDSTRPSVYALNDYRKWQTRVQNEPSELGSEMNPNWGQKQTQTRSTATKKKSDTKETYKETFKEKETPPPDELSLEKSSLPHPSRKDNSTPAGSCESLQPHPFEEDVDPETLPPVDFTDLAGGGVGAEGDINPEGLPPVDWRDYFDALPPDLKDPAKFQAEAREIASESSDWELREQFNQCMKQEDPEAALWGRALEIKLAREDTC